MNNDTLQPDGLPISGRVKSAMLRKFDNFEDGTPDYSKGPVEVVKIEYNEDETVKSFTRHFSGDPQCR
jgi:hypothetical protein